VRINSIDTIREKLDYLLLPFINSANDSNKDLITRDYVTTLRRELYHYHKEGLGGYDFAVIFCNYIDRLIKTLYRFTSGIPNNTVAVVAVGGYGRGELNAHSDIDLLFLYQDTISEGFQNNILYPLWDIKLELGHSSRTVNECLDDADNDYMLLTSLMDHRYLAGNYDLYMSFHERFCEMIKNRANKLFYERENEMYERRKKYSAPVYMLEPHIKEGAGSLRDVHNMLWLTQLFTDITNIMDLRNSDFFNSDTYDQFMSNYNILMRLRNEMHFLNNSKNDRLTLEVQKHLSVFSGYENEEDLLGVEKFLSDYYEITHNIAELANDYIWYLKEKYIIPTAKEETRRIGEYYRISHKHLLLQENCTDIYEKHPEEIINTFRILADNDLIPAKTLKDIVKKEVTLLQTEGLLEKVFPAFLALFSRNKLSKTLYLMHDYGILSILIEEFKAISYRVQYDMYHIYTVGTHSIKTVEETEKIGDGVVGYFLQSLYQQTKNKTVLMLAAFLHDIGKGHGKDHSRKGSEIAYNIVLRLGVSETDAELISFFVRNHLVLSDTAQRSDINDEKLIYDFSKLIKNRENLKMLYILTVADLRAVSSTVWTEWKGALLNDLYKRSEEALEQGLDMAKLTTEKYQYARAQIKQFLKDKVDGSIIEEFLDGFKIRYFTAYSPQEILEHFDLINKYKTDGVLSVTGKINSQLAYTKISVCTTDRPGLFSVIAGVLLANRANIMDANISVRTDGIIIDVFRVSDMDKLHAYSEHRLQKFTDELRDCLLNKITVEALLSAGFKPSILKEKIINKQPTEITVNEDASDIYTLLEIYTHDRQRLLYDITSTISMFNLNIVVAKITTRIDQVADIFYLERIGGGKIANAADAERLISALTFITDKTN